MAFIKIKGRREPLVVANDLAKKIKERKFGVSGHEAQADPSEGVTIIHQDGEWDGEYGRIAEIDMQKTEERIDLAAQMRKEDHERDEWLLKRPADVKGAEMGYFKLLWSGRTGDYKTDPPPEILTRVQKLQTRYFTKYTRAFLVPAHLYGTLLPKKVPYKTLAEKMRIEQLPEKPALESASPEKEITYPTD